MRRDGGKSAVRPRTWAAAWWETAAGEDPLPRHSAQLRFLSALEGLLPAVLAVQSRCRRFHWPLGRQPTHHTRASGAPGIVRGRFDFLGAHYPQDDWLSTLLARVGSSARACAHTQASGPGNPTTEVQGKDSVAARPGSPFALNPEMKGASPKIRTAPRRRARVDAPRAGLELPAQEGSTVGGWDHRAA
ncbi:hypothetical protein AB1E18_016435 [Capra hircus]